MVAVRAAGPTLLAALAVTEAWRATGSVASRDWTGYALLAALALAVVLASGAAAGPPRTVLLATGGLVALAAWDAVALAWSPSPSLGRDEVLLVVLYAVALILPPLVLRTPVDRFAAFAAILAVAGGSALLAFLRLRDATDPAAVYRTGRLEFPISYTNAQAALFLVAFWPAVALAAARTLPVLARAAGVGLAAAAVAGWAMVQSKGGLVGLVVSTAVVLALHRRRLRLLPPLAIVGVAAVVGFRALTEPYRAAGGDGELAAIRSAATSAFFMAGAAAAAGLVYAAVDRRVVLRERTSRTIGLALAALALAAAGAGVALFLSRHPDPAAYIAAKWSQAKRQQNVETGGSHLSALGSNRYDFWRVALSEARASPIAGIGTRGFRAAYLQNRNSRESPARAHSLELDALSETGVVGLLLLVTALGLVLVSLVPRARSDLVAVGTAGTFTYWLAHSSVDWTWSFPAVGLIVFALAGVGAARSGPAILPRRAALPAAALAAAVAVGAFGLPWLATQYVRAALDDRRTAPASLARARSLDPISLDPYLAAAALAPTAAAQVEPLRAALRQEPRSADLRFALGRAYLVAGDRRAAVRFLRSALAVDPGDPAILDELRRARRR